MHNHLSDLYTVIEVKCPDRVGLLYAITRTLSDQGHGHSIEALYELPREVWEHDIDGSQHYSEALPTEGAEALIDRTDNPVFDGKQEVTT